MTPVTAPAPRPAAADTAAALRIARERELRAKDARREVMSPALASDMNHLDLMVEQIRALAADLDATRAERDAARAALPDAGLVDEYADSVPYSSTSDWLRKWAAAIRALDTDAAQEVAS